jgi:hypothetical protein
MTLQEQIKHAELLGLTRDQMRENLVKAISYSSERVSDPNVLKLYGPCYVERWRKALDNGRELLIEFDSQGGSNVIA